MYFHGQRMINEIEGLQSKQSTFSARTPGRRRGVTR